MISEDLNGHIRVDLKRFWGNGNYGYGEENAERKKVCQGRQLRILNNNVLGRGENHLQMWKKQI